MIDKGDEKYLFIRLPGGLIVFLNSDSSYFNVSVAVFTLSMDKTTLHRVMAFRGHT